MNRVTVDFGADINNCFYVRVVDAGHLMTAGDNPHSLILCVLKVPLVGVA